MILYSERGRGLHAAIAAAGHWLRQVDGHWMADDEAAVQAIIDAYPLAALQADVVADIDAHARALRELVVRDTSPAEMASWPIKRAEALAFAANGDPASAPMLAVEAAARGVSLGDMAAMVTAKATALSALEAAISGTAGRHADAVRAMQTFEQVLAYDWKAGWPL